MHWIALQPQPEAPAQAGSTDATGDVSNDAARLADPLRALGWWALRYTPKVVLLADAVLMEVSACTRLWGGRAALLRHIYMSKKPVALINYAQGDTSLIALARLIQTPARSVAGAPPPDHPAAARTAGRPPDAPDDLPLHTLLAAQPHLATLARLGCTTWGQLRALPRGGLARRFGAALVDALDQAYGQRPDVYLWLTLPEVFAAALELPSAVESASALLFGARRLLAQLQVWLRLRQRGVLALELAWQMDARRHTAKEGALVLRTAEPAQDTAHLQRLLAERLHQTTLPAPALWLHLRSLETQPLVGQSASLLPDEQPHGDSLVQLLERLSARLGADKVLRCQLQADHRPEQMQAWLAADNTSNSIATCAYSVRARGQKIIKNAVVVDSGSDGTASPLLPTWLLAVPRKLSVRQGQPQYQGPLTLLAGPQRLESGWWADQADAVTVVALRDYFVARTCCAVLLWIYRERLGHAAQQAAGDWYLHGVFA